MCRCDVISMLIFTYTDKLIVTCVRAGLFATYFVPEITLLLFMISLYYLIKLNCIFMSSIICGTKIG